MSKDFGFVQLRRGIIEHLTSRKISADEYCLYSLIILHADHKTGKWKGSAKSLAFVLNWSPRQCQYILASLRKKQYISGECKRGFRSYWMTVNKYFRVTHGDALLNKSDAWGCATRAKVAHGDATSTRSKELQEVSSFNKGQNRTPFSTLKPKRDEYPDLRIRRPD